MSDRRPRVSEAGSARQRRAWWLGGTLIACVVLATVAVALNDLRVRREAGERYLLALADSHARQVGHEIDTVERAFHGLADGLAALQGTPDAGAVLARAAIADISAANPHIRHLRLDARPPAFTPARPFHPHRLRLGRPLARDADGRRTLPVAMLLEPGPPGTPWLHGAIDVEVFSLVLRAHEVGPRGVASVLAADGTLIARSDSDARNAGLDARSSPVFRALGQADSGMVESRGQLDGVRRVVGYRRVDGRPSWRPSA